jgi:hypothetical protein
MDIPTALCAYSSAQQLPKFPELMFASQALG